jgi:hypothetical protein
MAGSRRRFACVAALAVLLAGCGSSRKESRTRVQPIVQDLGALRQAAGAGTSDETMVALNRLLNAAQAVPGDREGWKGTALIRRRLPQIVERFLADYRATRQRLVRVRLRTRAGTAVKALLLAGYDVQRRRLLSLRAEVDGGTYAWGDVLRWIGENNLVIARFDTRLRSILRALPVDQRRAVDRALARPARSR